MDSYRVTVAKLTNENFQTWRYKMEMLLKREELWHVISQPKPEKPSAEWLKDDMKANATIGLSLEDDQISLIRECTTAKDSWLALKAYHEKASEIYLLKRLLLLQLGEEGNMEEHIRKFSELLQRLAGSSDPIPKKWQVAMLLCSLPPSYDPLVTALEQRPLDEISLEFVKSKLLADFEKRKERSATSSSERALRSTESNKRHSPRVCHFCKKPGHLMANCRKRQQQHKPNGEAKTVISTASGTAFVANGGCSKAWIIDSGASAHMCNDKEFFTELNHFTGGFIILANGEKTRVMGEGKAAISVIDGNQNERRITFSDLKYVPGLEVNLISVDRLTTKNMSVTFNHKGCKIIDEHGTVVATGVRYNGQYYLRLIESAMTAASDQHLENCQHQWHRRMGHRDWGAMQRINTEQLGTGMKVVDCGIKMVCECCLKGKSTRSPFQPVTERKSKKVLDIVHTDVCGPMETLTPSGNRYAMHIIDDFSRFTVTFLLKKKSEAADKIVDYVNWVENLFGRKPRFIRSDGGGEFDNTKLRSFYVKNGIKPQFTTPYSPQSNGVAERKNRTITEMATCMLMDSGLDKRFWGEAMLTATYLHNRLPSLSVSKTPHELWWKSKPDLKHLRIFGSDAYVHVPKIKRSKLDEKAIKLKLVGYSSEHKAYRFVNPETNEVTISRDARFIENTDCPSLVEVPLHTKSKENSNSSNDETKTSGTINEESGDDSFEDAKTFTEERRSERKSNVPKHLEDYVLGYAAGVASCAREEPISFKEAVKEEEWREAMLSEMESHRKIGTWEIVPLPSGRKAIGSRWVYKIKRDENDKIIKYKARIVAQGFAQEFGVDYYDVYAPVTNQTTFRIFLTVAAKRQLTVHHLDVKTAYLNGSLQEEVYMRQPPGFAIRGQEELVCRLKRSIYGLHQSARCWYLKLSEVLSKLGFKASSTDQCLYRKSVNGKTSFLLVYVDDILVATSTEQEAEKIRIQLCQEFDITCLGKIKFFLGMEVQRSGSTFKLRMKPFIEKMLEAYGMKDAKSAKSPMDQGYVKQSGEEEPIEDVTKYRSLVGGLLYLAVTVRPDIAAATAILGRKFASPTLTDWTAAKRVLRFLQGTKEYFLQLGGAQEEALCGYSDSDWAGDVKSRRSTSGFVFMYCGGAVSWASRKQTSVTLSSMEAEYVALSAACQEIIWLRKLLRDFEECPKDPTVMKEDNQGCLAFVKTERTHRRSKHIDTKERFVKELCDRKEIVLEYCPTEEMIADIMTKPLGPQKHEWFSKLLNLG